MERVAIGLAVAGAVVLGLSIAGARRPVIHPLEQRAFHLVNGLPDWLFVPLWVPMQLGNLVVGSLVGLLVAWAFGDWAMAVAVVLATALKLVTERVLRREMARFLVVRQRPATSERGAIVRGRDVPTSGPSFPSGHVILVTAVACVVVDDIALGWSWAPFLVAGLVMVGRVYVGAHNPLDVTAGLGAGLLIGGALEVLLGFV